MSTQMISNPFGITVFGSAISRVEPDIASLHFAVSRLEQQPKDAFRGIREDAQKVRTYLVQNGVTDIGSSQVTLEASFSRDTNQRKFEGYRARIEFNVLIRRLDRVDDILTGVIEAGVNELHGTSFQTSRLKEIRADSRMRAIQAAREKAELYCEAAGVVLGSVLHIEDANPEALRASHVDYTAAEPQSDDDTIRAIDPGSITVGAAVRVAYSLKGE
jgi:uncharacterized protein